jgi:hypothetical protein
MHGVMWSASMTGALGITQPNLVSDKLLKSATIRGATVLPVAVFEVLSAQVFPTTSNRKRSRRLPDFLSSGHGSTCRPLSLPTMVLMARALKEFNSLRRRVRFLPAHKWTQLAVSVAKEYDWEIPVVQQKMSTDKKVEGVKRVRSAR